MNFREELNRVLLTRALATAEAQTALTALQKCRWFQQDIGGWRNWIVEALPDFTSLDLAGSYLDDVAAIEIPSLRGTPVTEELWCRFWERSHTLAQGRHLRVSYSEPTKSMPRKGATVLTAGYYRTGVETRWSIGLSGDGLLQDLGITKSPAGRLDPAAQRLFVETYQPLFGLNYEVRLVEGKASALIPEDQQQCSRKASYAKLPFVVTLNYSGKDPSVPGGLINVDTNSREQASTICGNIRRHFAGYTAKILEWTDSFRIRSHMEAAAWLSAEYSPPWIVSYSPRIERPMQPRWLADEVRRAGYIWPLGEWLNNSDSVKVDLVSLGAGREAPWRLWFTSLDEKQDKARVKLAAQLQAALKIPRLFDCEQLVEKYAHLCQ